MGTLSLRFWSRRPQASAPDIPLADRAAFSDLYHKAHRDVFRYALGFLGDVAQAEDITAETFLKAWDKRLSFTGDQGAALRWLLTIAKRLIINRWHKTQRQPTHISLNNLALADANLQPEQHLIQQEQQAALRRLVATLPHEQQEMLVLRYVLGWQVNAIAAHTGQKANTVSVT